MKQTLTEDIIGKVFRFIPLNITGWIVFLLFRLNVFYSYTGYISFPVFINYFVFTVAGFAVTLPLRKIYTKVFSKDLPIPLFLISVLIISTLTTLVWFGIEQLFNNFLFGFKRYFNFGIIEFILERLFFDTFTIIIWSILYFVIKIYGDWERRKKELDEIELEIKIKELNIVKNRIEPDYIFCELNTIKKLIRIDKTEASSRLNSLSDFLRNRLNLLSKSDGVQ